jgi:hypothetical protein
MTNRSAGACPLIAVGPRACKEPAGSRREHRSGSEHSGPQRPQNPDPEPEIPDEPQDSERHKAHGQIHCQNHFSRPPIRPAGT